MRAVRIPLLFTLLCLLLCIVVTGSVVHGSPLQARSARELLVEIARDRDGVDPKVFDQLAILGDQDAFRSLQRGIGYLKGETQLTAAYRAFRHFSGREAEVVEEVVEFLEEEANKSKREFLRPVALEGLLHFRDAAVRPLERVVKRQKDPELRRTACDALVPWLGKQEDPESLALILANASLRLDRNLVYIGVSGTEALELGQKKHREVVREILAARRSDSDRSAMAEHMLDKDSSRRWKLLLIDLFAKGADRDTTELLAKLLKDDDTAVVLLVLELLMERDDWFDPYGKLKPLLRSRERSVRRAAVVAMGGLLVIDARWRKDAMKLASHKDPALRMGAAFALAQIRTVEAIPVLYELLVDRDWSVRAETLRHVTELRRKDSIPILIARLGVETGRLRPDVYKSLRILTGLDHGRTPERWERWWKGEGASFELPDHAVAVEAENQRLRANIVGATRSDTFYGVNVQSERICFVLDISHSMDLPMGAVNNDVSRAKPGAPTRMEAAKKELSLVLRKLPDGTLFNVVFFETRVRALSETLVRMSRGMRQKSLRFVSDQFALGSTAFYPAIKLAFDDPLVDTIYFLSDGAPTEGEITDIEEIREEVRRWNSARHVRIHGVTMGQDSTLLRWLCEDTGGTYVRVD
jgi:hypothetical protein